MENKDNKNQEHNVRNKKLHGASPLRIVLYWIGAIVSVIALAAFWLTNSGQTQTNSSETASVPGYIIEIDC